MFTKPQDNPLTLIDRLATALAGTAGRVISAEALLELASLEISDWRQEHQAAAAGTDLVPLIAGQYQLS